MVKMAGNSEKILKFFLQKSDKNLKMPIKPGFEGTKNILGRNHKSERSILLGVVCDGAKAPAYIKEARNPANKSVTG